MLNQLKDVFAYLQKHEVRYLIIGGIAAILYGVPRATFDLDILVEATRENVQKLLDAFLDAGLGTAALTTAEDVLAHEITIFKDYVRIDVQTSTPGLVFAGAWRNRQAMSYAGQEFYLVSRDDLIAAKRAAGRDRDLEDVRLLELGDDESGRL